MASVRVRFPPSPTGYCHVGTARMALLNYLLARKAGGTIIFRSEDTDRERSKKEYEVDIIESIRWLGLSWDEFYRQSERLPRHVEAIDRLLAAGSAYVSREESKREPGNIVEVIRLRNSGATITFHDVIRGNITFDTGELGDFIIARAVDDPLYHLAVVVDDAEMGISHVVRGEEHISNTPRQILIQEALGYERPIYAHYPLFLGAEREKLSKRNGETAVRDYRAQGFLPEATLNFIGTLGWTPPSGREILSLAEMVDEFEVADLHKSGAVFDIEKLRWFNRQYVGRMSPEAFHAYAAPALADTLHSRNMKADERIRAAVLPILRERISVRSDIERIIQEGELDFLFIAPTPDPKLLPEKRSNPEEASTHLARIEEMLLETAGTDWNSESVKAAVWEYATEHGRGSVLWPLRYALTGREKSPDPFMVAGAIGKDETLRRIATARRALSV